MNARWQYTIAVSMPNVRTALAPIIAHAAMVFVETGGPAMMLTNARGEPTIAVSMLTVQTVSDLITAPVAMDFKETVGHARI